MSDEKEFNAIKALLDLGTKIRDLESSLKRFHYSFNGIDVEIEKLKNEMKAMGSEIIRLSQRREQEKVG
jgi:uncharacterized coiled-coil DUF342 family protein